MSEPNDAIAREYIPLQFFETHTPTREDALEALRLAIALLEYSLPTALCYIRNETIESQYWFWYSFTKFEEANDLMQEGWLENDFKDMTERLSEFGDHIAALLHRAAQKPEASE